MNQWAFVIAAYALTFGGTGAVIAWALAAMRHAESQAERLRERR